MIKNKLIKKNSIIIAAIMMSLSLGLAGCGKSLADTNNTSDNTNVASAISPEVLSDIQVADAESARVSITDTFSIKTDVTDAVSNEGNVYTITKAGEYTLSGNLADGQIIVNIGDSDEVTLILNKTSVSCSYASPIYINGGSKVKIKSEEDTFNEITDSRATQTVEDIDTSSMSLTEAAKYGNAAIYATCDLSLTGKGSLVVNGSYNNGVQTKDDLSIKNVCLKVTSYNNSIKGNDSVEIESGDITLISKAGNGIKTSNDEISSKGNQKGNITISGGSIDITSANDGINAIYEAIISGGSITINAGDDGIHADKVLTINDGTINIKKSYEGLEAIDIEIHGGNIFVYASDDGLNACSEGGSSNQFGGFGAMGGKGNVNTASSSSSSLINITGGYVDVTTPAGDTDAIDSNGNFTMSGGFVLIKGGNSSGRMAGSLDTDGTVVIKGGTVVALGGICETPTNSVNAYVSGGTTFAAGDYSLKDSDGKEIASFSLTSTYYNGWICSDGLVTGKTYTLYNGTSSLLNWTQTEGTAGSAGSNAFGNPGAIGGKGDMNGNRMDNPNAMNGNGMDNPNAMNGNNNMGGRR